MARLDQLVAILQERSGDSIEARGGSPIVLRAGDKSTPITPTLSREQLLSFVKEMLPATELEAKLTLGEPLAFTHASASGPVSIEIRTVKGEPTVTILPPGVSRPSPSAGPSPGSRVESPNADIPPKERLERLLGALVRRGASDLHLRAGLAPIFRKDGELVRDEGEPLVAEEIQMMHESIMSERDKDLFSNTGDADYAHEVTGLARFRCNAARDRGGPMGVFRVIPSRIPTCEEMGISPEVQKLCFLNKGLVIVTGPTGSGKSTTLAAMVDLMNRERRDHILTIEDPIEFVHESKGCIVTHRQVGLHTQSFKTGLRAALREDPDIVLIGEMRDLETVAIAIETAETGHLVLGTLHTTTATSTIDRIVDQFPADQQAQIRTMLAESLRGVIAQTLCRKVGGGRIAAREVLLASAAVSNLIREGKAYQIPSIMQTSRNQGMITLNDALIQLLDQKLIDPREAFFRAVDRPGIRQALTARGHNPDSFTVAA